MYSDDPDVNDRLKRFVKDGHERAHRNRAALARDRAEMQAILDRKPGTPSAPHRDTSAARDRSAALRKYLEARPHSWYTTRDLAAILKCNPSAARRSLQWLRRQGVVASGNRGWTIVTG